MANSQISCIDSGVSQPLKRTTKHHWFIAMRSLGKFGCSGGWFGVCSYDKCPGDTFGNIFGSQCTAALTQMISHRMAAFPPSSEWMTNNFCYSGSHSGKPYCNSFPCTNRTQANDGDMVMSPGPWCEFCFFSPSSMQYISTSLFQRNLLTCLSTTSLAQNARTYVAALSLLICTFSQTRIQMSSNLAAQLCSHGATAPLPESIHSNGFHDAALAAESQLPLGNTSFSTTANSQEFLLTQWWTVE